MTQSFCHPLHSQPISTSVVITESKPAVVERKLVDTDLLKTQKEELERIYKQRLEDKDRTLKELEDNRKIQEARIDFLHSELKAAEEKVRMRTDELKQKNEELNRLRDEHARELQHEYTEK